MSTKKLLCILASVVLAVTLLTVGVFAATTGDVASLTTASGQTTYYDTLIEAVEAATEGDTVTLLQDTSGGGIVIGKIDGQKNFTIDFNGHTYTVNSSPLAGSSGTETQCFQLLKATESLTMKNGTIVADYSGVKMMIQNYCSLTLENMTLDATVGANNVGYVLSNNNNGNTTITGSTTITAKSTGVAFDVFYWPEYGYTSVSVTVDSSDVTINGTVEYSAYTTVDPENTVLTISAGTVNGTIVASNLNEDEEATILVATTATVSGGVTGSAALVAEAGGVQYTSLQAAIDAAGTSGTVTLLKDTTEDIEIDSTQTITLDLNGYTITNASGHTITNYGTLTVTGSGTVDNTTHQKGALVNYGTAYLNGGTFTRSAEAGASSTDNGGNSWYTVKNYNQMTVDGATIENSGSYSSCFANGYQNASDKTNAQTITGDVTPTLTILSGTVSGGINSVKNDDCAVLVIEGGTFINYTQASLQNHSTATVNGGTFTADSAYAVINCGCDADIDVGVLTINGGTFTGTYALYDQSTANTAKITITGGNFTGTTAVLLLTSDSSAEIAISGGVFSDEGIEPYVIAGLTAVQLDANTWVVGTLHDVTVEINNSNYGTVDVDWTSAVSGMDVTITATPIANYKVTSVLVNGSSSGVVDNGNGTWTFSMPNGNVTVSVTFARYKDEISGIFYVNESYHGIMVNGHLLSIPHTVNEAGYCTTCGAYIGVEEEEVELEEEVTEEVVEVEDPVESGETDSEDDGEEAPAETPTEEESNPTTGVALGLVPMAIAAVAVAVSKKH